ncbi:MAG: EAL domain-containing protein [Pseudolabrys sp.]|nr:EAL domain-containing protein [Pseudolabrys sp.]
MALFPRKKLYGAIAGALLAGAPLIAFDVWIGGLLERQGSEESLLLAKRAVALAETRVSQTISMLDGLAAAGVNSCSPEHLAAMRRAVFLTAPVKGVAVIDADNQPMCTQVGPPNGISRILSAEPLENVPGYALEVIEAGGGQRMVRLRRKAGGGVADICAVIPVELFLPQISTNGGPLNVYASVTTGRGALIGTNGALPSDQADGSFSGGAQSSKYGFIATTTLARWRAIENHSDLSWLSHFAAIALGLLIVTLGIILPRRETGNPVAELQRALEAGEFVPYYQPLVDIRSGQLRGAEVLVRWKKPDGSLVLPGAFIPLAESSGMILALTRDLMKRVCAEAGPAIGKRPGLKISFNFAAQLFRSDSIVKDVRNIFVGSPIQMSQVVLELTERDPIENLTETRRVVAALQGLGVRIAIDDVGTGHSGLSYMLKLGVDIIKIDKMFVDAIGTDRNSTTIVETLVDLAHNMRMDVVAEGVENFEQVVHLRELGIRSAQGYVFAPPLPGSAFLQLVESLDPLPAAAVESKVAESARRYMDARTQFDAA